MMRRQLSHKLFGALCGCLCSAAASAQQPNNTLVPPKAGVGIFTGAEGRPVVQPHDCLEPEEGYLVSYAYAANYYPKLRELLYAGLGDSPVARVVVLPSFAPEYVISIDQKARTYYLTYRVCQTSLWSALAKKGKQVAVDTKTVELSQELATAVARLFNAAVDQTKYPEPIPSMNSDGTTFTFSTFRMGIGLRGGKTWSPQDGTHMGALVALVSHLQRIATAPDDHMLRVNLLAEANQLTVELKAK